MKLKYRFLKIAICLALLILMLNFSIQRFENSKLANFNIEIKDGDRLGFIQPKNIKEQFQKLYTDSAKLKIKDLKVQDIENELRKNPYTDSVNVYLDQNKNLNFYLIQKEPIIRINDGKGVYYLTEDGNKVPISHQFSMPVLMVEGKISEEEYPQLIELQQLINADKLLKKHIVGVKKQGDNSFILLVNVDDFVIELGNLEDLDGKLTNLKAFYHQYLNHVGLGKYKEISVKYKNQIVATKK